MLVVFLDQPYANIELVQCTYQKIGSQILQKDIRHNVKLFFYEVALKYSLYF